MNLSWTADELSTLRSMWADGKTGTQIADALGSTRSAVLGKVNRLGLTRETSRPKRKATARPRLKKPRPSFPFIDRKPPPPKPAVVWGPVLIWDLTPRHCRWIPGDPTTLLYCGLEKISGSVYCQKHTAESGRNRWAA